LPDKRSRLARWLRGEGIEIGALHRPLTVPEAARVTYVDRFPEEELRRHYPELSGQPLAPVSVLGSAQDLSAFADGSLDFVIANHLLEHLEDPIKALKEFHRVLRKDGVLYLALPDPRVSFDRDRQLTSLEHLLDEHRHGTLRNRHDHYIDWARNVDKDADVAGRAERLMQMDYSIHFHVWKPDSFMEFLVAARLEAQLDFETADFAAPEHPQDDEFIFILLKGSSRELRLPQPSDGQIGAAARSQGSLRARVAASAIGPWIRPAYRRVRRLFGVRPRDRKPSLGSR
jgi:SAM-dependent methyltransferase